MPNVEIPDKNWHMVDPPDVVHLDRPFAAVEADERLVGLAPLRERIVLFLAVLAAVVAVACSRCDWACSRCDWIVMKPHGDIAVQQADLIVTSTLLMLLIIVPVIALTLFTALREQLGLRLVPARGHARLPAGRHRA